MSWEESRLGDFLTLKRGYDLPASARNEGAVPIISSSGVTGYHDVAKVNGPGVVTGRYGTLGEVFYVEGDYWPLNTALYVQDFKGHKPQFAAYLLEHVLAGTFSDKAAVPGVNRNHLHARKIRTTRDAAEQGAVITVLAAYDDLLENNRRRIQLLEQGARLLYKEWFVHFRFPGHEHVKIIDGVPERWAQGVVSDFYATGSGGTPSRKKPDFYAGEIPWVKTQELTGAYVLATGERITEEGLRRSSAKLFPRHTVLIAMYGATIGQTAILGLPCATNQACCAVIPQADGTSYVHAYLFFTHHKADLVALGQGAAQRNVSQQVIRGFRMVLPPRPLLDSFAQTVTPFINQVETLERSNISLKIARDLLLPRLMNGEMSV